MSGKQRSTTENPVENDPPEEPQEATLVTPEGVEPVGRGQLSKATSQPAFVQYVGTAHVREIDAAAWRQIGVEGQGKVVWDKKKFRGDRVPADQFSPDALEYLDQFDEGFILLGEDGKRL